LGRLAAKGRHAYLKSIIDGREVTFYEKVTGDYLYCGSLLIVHRNGIYALGRGRQTMHSDMY
jgi:hypothetical protein